MKRYVVFAMLSLMFLAAPLYAAEESPCDKCRNEANKELMKCIEGAISQEDKKFCTDRAEEKVKSCKQSECKISPGK